MSNKKAWDLVEMFVIEEIEEIDAFMFNLERTVDLEAHKPLEDHLPEGLGTRFDPFGPPSHRMKKLYLYLEVSYGCKKG